MQVSCHNFEIFFENHRKLENFFTKIVSGEQEKLKEISQDRLTSDLVGGYPIGSFSVLVVCRVFLGNCALARW